MPALEEYSETNPWLAEASRTVDIFSGLLGRTLYLIDASQHEATREYTHSAVYVNFTDDYLYEVVEFGLAHIVFGSDARRRDAFAEEYAQAVQRQIYAKAKTSFTTAVLQKTLQYIVGVLEQERLLSLWKVLYPGSVKKIQSLRFLQTQDTAAAHQDAPNILLWFTLASFGHPLPPSMHAFGSVFAEALAHVQRGSFDTTLYVAKWLFFRIMDTLHGKAAAELGLPVEKLAFETKLAVLEGAIDGNFRLFDFSYFKTNNFSFPINAFTAPKGSPPDESIGALINKQDPISELAQEKKKTAAQLKKLQAQLTEPQSQETYARRDTGTQVQMHDVRKSADYYTLTREDIAAAERIRARVSKVLGRRANALEFSGLHVDVQAYIQRLRSQQPDPAFQVDVSGRGFRCLLLIDRSGSMGGIWTAQCERACKILRYALKFPFIEIHVWGYAERVDHVVEILRFGNQSGFDTGKALTGNTPTHVALRAALNFMLQGTDTKHIFLVTDGTPTDTRSTSSAKVYRQVRKTVLEARSKGIGVTTLMVGEEDDKHFDFMYLPGHWRRLREQVFGMDVAQVVLDSFMRYARVR